MSRRPIHGRLLIVISGANNQRPPNEPPPDAADIIDEKLEPICEPKSKNDAPPALAPPSFVNAEPVPPAAHIDQYSTGVASACASSQAASCSSAAALANCATTSFEMPKAVA